MQTADSERLEVPFDLLLEKLNVSDYYHLKKLLSANNLPIIPNKKPVQYPIANRILKSLRGNVFSRKELRKYVQRPETPVITTLRPIDGLPTAFEEYALATFSRISLGHAENTILAIGIEGGYFAELARSTFFFEFKKGVHFLIGERGTGKSTLLNAAAAYTWPSVFN